MKNNSLPKLYEVWFTYKVEKNCKMGKCPKRSGINDGKRFLIGLNRARLSCRLMRRRLYNRSWEQGDKDAASRLGS